MSDRISWPDILGREKDGDQLRFELGLPRELVWFEGHFPGCPILPGVIQIHWAASLFLRETGHDLVFRHMEAIKFRQLLLPEMSVVLELEYDPGRARLAFHYSSASAEFSTGRIYWRDA